MEIWKAIRQDVLVHGLIPRDVAGHSGEAELCGRLPAGVTAEDHAVGVEVDRLSVPELLPGLRRGIACRMVPDGPAPSAPTQQRALLAKSQHSAGGCWHQQRRPIRSGQTGAVLHTGDGAGGESHGLPAQGMLRVGGPHYSGTTGIGAGRVGKGREVWNNRGLRFVFTPS
jgi:hypothetical protein